MWIEIIQPVICPFFEKNNFAMVFLNMVLERPILKIKFNELAQIMSYSKFKLKKEIFNGNFWASFKNI